MPLTLGTAGHIDHGKTTLVRALTGVDTDRLPEERARGISIALGYAPLTLPSGRTLSVVDVPGHERFVRTMVAGATGIDLYLMVVAADDGVMPQTREHATVLAALGVDDRRRRDHEVRPRRPGASDRRGRGAAAGRRDRDRRGRCARRARPRRRSRGEPHGGRSCAPPRRPRLQHPRRRHGRHRHALVGHGQPRRPRHDPSRRTGREGPRGWRSTTNRSSSPRPASASR